MLHTRLAGVRGRVVRTICVWALAVAQVFVSTPYAPVTTAYAAETAVEPGTGLQAAIAAAAPGDTLVLSAGDYTTSGTVLVNKALTITGAGIDQTVIKTTTNTTGMSIVTSNTTGWFRVAPAGELTISGLTLDGEHSAGRKVGAAIYASGPLHASGIRVTDVWYGKYYGVGLALIGSGHEVIGSTFDAVERLCLYIGAGSTADAPPLPPEVAYGTLVDGCTFVGAGRGDYCQYSMEVGRSGRAIVRNSEFSQFSGITASGAWNSAGLVVDSIYGSGVASLTLESSTFTDCDWGVEVGVVGQPRDTVLNMSGTRFNRVAIDLTLTGAVSTMSIPAGVGNVSEDHAWTFYRYSETGTTITPSPELPDGFINWKPRVNPDDCAVAKNLSFSGDVLGNDVDSNDDTLTVTRLSDVATGTLTFEPAGGFEYVPPPGYTGVQQFTYRVADWLTSSAVTTVTLTVADTAPLALDDDWDMRQGGLLIAGGSGVLVNDSDENGDDLSIRLVDDVDHGSLMLHADGTFLYQPAASFAGVDTFSYQAFDGSLLSDVATVSITVENEVPTALGDAHVVPPSGILAVSVPGVLTNDADSNSDQVTAHVLSAPTFGALVLAANGSFIYVPRAGFPGTDTFTYRAHDTRAYSDPATVTITGVPIPYPSAIALTSVSETLPAYGATFTVSGVLTTRGEPLAGRRVVLKTTSSTFGQFAETAVVATTAADGSFTLVHLPRVRTFYRAGFAGEEGVYESTDSSVSAALPRALVGRPSLPKTMSRNRAATVSGYLKPRHLPGTYPIRIYRYRYVSGRWRSYGFVRARAYNLSTYTRYSKSVKLPYRGRWRLRVYHAADANHAGSWSATYRYVTVK